MREITISNMKNCLKENSKKFMEKMRIDQGMYLEIQIVHQNKATFINHLLSM